MKTGPKLAKDPIISMISIKQIDTLIAKDVVGYCANMLYIICAFGFQIVAGAFGLCFMDL